MSSRSLRRGLDNRALDLQWLLRIFAWQRGLEPRLRRTHRDDTTQDLAGRRPVRHRRHRAADRRPPPHAAGDGIRRAGNATGIRPRAGRAGRQLLLAQAAARAAKAARAARAAAVDRELRARCRRDPNAFNYDAKPEIAAYAAGVARELRGAPPPRPRRWRPRSTRLLANPTDATLAAARKAWVAARPAYLVTEAFRFYDGPIEDVEGEINAWPLNEAFIDYVEGKPERRHHQRPTTEISHRRSCSSRTRSSDESRRHHRLARDRVPALGPGPQRRTARATGRSPTTSPGKGNNDRRRAYLKLVTDLLVADLDGWPAPGRRACRTTTPPRSRRCRRARRSAASSTAWPCSPAPS